MIQTSYWPQTRIQRRGLVGSQNIRRLKHFKNTAVYLAIFFLFLLGYVWTRVQVVETGYRLRQREADRERLQEENRSLLVEAATLKSPQRLEEIAGHLGLSRPNEHQIFFLGASFKNE